MWGVFSSQNNQGRLGTIFQCSIHPYAGHNNTSILESGSEPRRGAILFPSIDHRPAALDGNKPKYVCLRAQPPNIIEHSPQLILPNGYQTTIIISLAHQSNAINKLTLVILGEIPSHDLIDSSPFRRRRGTSHSALGLLGGGDGGGGSTPCGEEGGAAPEDGERHV